MENLTDYQKKALSFRLLLSSWVVALRSQSGFALLMSIIRVIGCIGLGFTFIVFNNSQTDQAKILIVLYFAVASLIFFLVLLFKKLPENIVFHYLSIGLDVSLIIALLLIKNDAASEIYVLLLIPLVTSAHFVPRWIAVLFTILIVTFYGLTFFNLPNVYAANPSTVYQLIYVWVFRSAFLSIGAWLYRIQRSIPSPKAGKILSPSAAREKLEKNLEQLRNILKFETASVQLIYQERLLIVACWGFPSRQDIYSIEFPVDNPNFPNYYVINNKSNQMVSTSDYPSFRDHIYQANHVKTWLGVPLISPVSGEVIGLLSIDSSEEKAFSKMDIKNASKMAMKLSAFLVETTLGPAALTMLTMRESLKSSVRAWSRDLAQRAITCKDDIEAAQQIVKICKQIFRVEDCSLYLLRPKYYVDKRKTTSVLHLIASTSIPSSQFLLHESLVSQKQGGGLTGHAVYKKNTINYSSLEIENSPYHGKYKANLEYLESKRSKQVMIVPIRNFLKIPVGALKIENKIGWPSDNRFTPYEQYLFETFTHTVGVLLEGIRQRNYINRQRTNFHHLRAMISVSILKPLDTLLKNPKNRRETDLDEYKMLRKNIGYVASEIDNLLLDPGESLILETEGVIPALLDFVSLLSSGFPHFRNAGERVVYIPSSSRDNLPYMVRETFFDIAREALLNAIRHSHVEDSEEGKIEVFFENNNNSYELTIKDNGVGFELEEALQRITSHGVKGMKKEIQNIERIGSSAMLSIVSKPNGGGTCVKVSWTA